jgi:hypothetical protein
MYKILIVYSLGLRDLFKNRGATAKNKMFIRLCYRGPDGHSLGLFCTYIFFFQNKKIPTRVALSQLGL